MLAWVGEHSDNSELVFTLSKELQDPGAPTSLPLRDFARWKDMIRAWSSFLDCRYFHRVWTFQEVVCHRHVLVCCGPDQQTWQDLIEDRYQLLTIRGLKPFLSLTAIGAIHGPVEGDRWITNARAVNTIDRARSDFAVGGTELLQYISKLRRRECSDRRDRVYAVVPLARDYAIAASIGADYTISIPELCYKVMMVITSKRDLIVSGTLKVLLHNLGCDHNETGSVLDLLLDRADSAIMDDWNWDIGCLVRDWVLTDYTEHRYDQSSERGSNLISWRTQARQRGSWPHTSGEGVYPPFQSLTFLTEAQF